MYALSKQKKLQEFYWQVKESITISTAIFGGNRKLVLLEDCTGERPWKFLLSCAILAEVEPRTRFVIWAEEFWNDLGFPYRFPDDESLCPKKEENEANEKNNLNKMHKRQGSF